MNANRSDAIEVCVCMAVHNGGPHLRQALEDILAQTFADFRLLVVDDGSTDGSGDVVREYACRDSRILLTENPVRRGLIGAWRQAVIWADQAFSPIYFAWYSDHDRVDPGFLDALYHAAKADPGLVCVYPQTRGIDADGVPVVLKRSRPSLETAGLSVWERLLKSVFDLRGSGDIVYGLMRMDAVQACGVFRDEIKPDRLLVSELNLHGGIRLVPEAVRHRRAFERSMNGLVGRQLQNLFPDGFVKTTPHLSHYSRLLKEALTSSDNERDDERFQRLMHGILYFLVHDGNLEEPVTPETTQSRDETALEKMLRACGPQPLFATRARYEALLEESRREKTERMSTRADLKTAILNAKEDRELAKQQMAQVREQAKQEIARVRELAKQQMAQVREQAKQEIARVRELAKQQMERDRKIARLAETLAHLVAPVDGHRTGPTTGPDTVTEPTIRRTCVMVLGMHRSGTSMVSGILHHWGMQVGRKLKSPSVNNEQGFFEDIAVKRLNDEILTSIGSRWDSPAPLREDWMTVAGAAGLRERVGETLELEYDLTLPMGIKDPRLCRLFPVWLPPLVERSFDVRVVIPFRNPLDVAASLGKRDGMPQSEALDLWKAYVEDALRHSHGFPRYFFDYDTFFSDPPRRLREIAGFLDLTGVLDSTLPAVMTFVSEGLRHHHSTARDHIPNEDAGRLYQELRALAEDQRS